MKNITPYKGFSDITFDMSFDEVKGLLREKRIQFNIENWPNKGYGSLTVQNEKSLVGPYFFVKFLSF